MELLVLDGALGTQLQSLGCDLSSPLWSADLLLDEAGCASIEQVHRTYAAAGADILTTASYQCSAMGFQLQGLPLELLEDTLRSATDVCRKVADAVGEELNKTILVAASVGPYGAALADGSEYRGDYALSGDDLVAWHVDRIRILADTPCDLLAVETVPLLLEALAVVRALQVVEQERKAQNKLTPQAWLALSVREEAGRAVLASGEDLGAAVTALLDADETVMLRYIGVNCCSPPVATLAVNQIARCNAAVQSVQQSTFARPIIVYANRGAHIYDSVTKEWKPGPVVTDHEYAAFAKEWHACGAAVVGGCCRTAPGTIRALAEAKAAGAFL